MAAKLALAEVKKRLTAFVHQFKNASNEQQEASIFWTRFYECYGIRAEEATVYEQAVKKLDGKRGRIDSFIPGKLIIEHKSKGKNLDDAYEQASDYFLALPAEQRPRYIITSDFAHIHLYDLRNKVSCECLLKQLPSKASWFKFLLDDEEAEIVEETPINRNAAYAISKVHEALLRAKFKGHDLEIFLTRLLFCLFADDTGIYGENNIFRRLVENTREDGKDLGPKLAELFDVFDQKISDRQTTLDDEIAAFPYINGALFSERARIPAFDSDLRKLLLESVVLDWSEISPAIFGAMFQGVLEEHSPDAKRQATRRELGAHYTSERNILRVINPLFMDDLRAELEGARRSKAKLQALYDKLPTLTFFDPACGCGNFLVIAYRELRRLELEIIDELFNFKHSKGLLDISTLCRVDVGQFYGIEIDDAAAHIARVALYITDHQLNTEAATRFGNTRATVPLVHTPHIVCANALRTDWNTILPAERCSYIVSNPPFVGKQYQSVQQKQDLAAVAGKVKNYGVLDFVTAWYFKAAEYIDGKNAEVALVSTNSVTQGEQVAVLWKGLAKYKLSINFAHRTFKWSNEGKANAAVHCVIIGFSQRTKAVRCIYDYVNGIDKEPTKLVAKNINPYLVDADWIVIENTSKPRFAERNIVFGSMPNDGGHLLLNKEKKDFLLSKCANATQFIRRIVGSEEFINNRDRWCLWLVDADPKALRSMPEVLELVDRVREERQKSSRETTRELAKTPTLFGEIRQPSAKYLALPSVSSERRKYIPLDFLSEDVIASNLLFVLPNATLYDFGILTSEAHMAWVRTVCGRLESRYRYSAGVVYNNFVFPPKVSDVQRNAIEVTAQDILDVRKKYSSSSLADLYDPLAMPADLIKAHEANNKAVDKAYGYKGASDDASRAAFLFSLFQKQTSSLPASTKAKRKAKV